MILSQLMLPDKTDANVRWARTTYERLLPFAQGCSYINYLGEDDGHRVEEVFGGNYTRLQALKDQYDPHNVLRWNQNIAPSSAQQVAT